MEPQVVGWIIWGVLAFVLLTLWAASAKLKDKQGEVIPFKTRWLFFMALIGGVIGGVLILTFGIYALVSMIAVNMWPWAPGFWDDFWR
jgi:hypothetical protein